MCPLGMNGLAKLKIIEESSFIGQTGWFRLIRPHQCPLNFQKFRNELKDHKKTIKYKLHYSDVQGDVLRLPHDTSSSCSEDE